MTDSKALILLIETSGDACSVALARDGECVGSCIITTPRMQSSRLAPMIEELLGQCAVQMADCNAVAVSSGPGSYTGLRVGVSMAKGLCFGASKPLIAVNTLDLLAYQGSQIAAREGLGPDYIVPMIDARRMEVYQAVYSAGAERTGGIEPRILDAESYSDLLEKGRVLFCGDGCDKFSGIISHPNAIFAHCLPEARYMTEIARRKYLAGDFEDVAYMEPFYLKDFRIGQSKKNILGL